MNKKLEVMTEDKVSFVMTLFNDESVVEALFDDERNDETDAYYEFWERFKLGESVRITIEKVLI